MSRRSTVAVTAIAAAVATVSASAAGAQDRAEVLAYHALLATPAGALPPTSFGAEARSPMRASAELLVAHMARNGGAETNYGISFNTSANRVRWSAVAGMIRCSGCERVAMLGLGAEGVLARRLTSAGTFAIGVQPSIGMGLSIDDADAGAAVAGTVRVPVSLTSGGRWRATVFASPAVSVARFTSGARGTEAPVVLSAGARLRNAWGLGLLVGVQHAMVDRAGTLVGLGVTLGS